MDTLLPFITKSGDWLISFIFLYLIIKLYIMRRMEELGEKIQKIGEDLSMLEKKIEEYNAKKIDRMDYYADYSEFKAELREVRNDIKKIFACCGGSK